MSRHWEDLVGPMYNTREKGCEAKVGGGVSALQRAREAEHIPSTVGRSLTGKPALCTGEWATCWCGSRGHWGCCPEPVDITSPALTLHCRAQGCPSTKPPLCCGQLCRGEKGLCAACSFLSTPSYYCSAFAASSTQQLSRISTCFSFFQEKRAHSVCLVQFPGVVSQPQH